MTVAYYYYILEYVIFCDTKEHIVICYVFKTDKTGSFVKAFFLLHWLLMLYKAKLNMYAHRISFSAARSRSTLVKGSLIIVPARVFVLLSEFFSLSKIHYNGPRYVTKTRAVRFIFYLRHKIYTLLFFSKMFFFFFLILLMCSMKHNILVYNMLCHVIFKIISCIFQYILFIN